MIQKTLRDKTQNRRDWNKKIIAFGLLFVAFFISTISRGQETSSAQQKEAQTSFAVIEKGETWVKEFSNQDIKALPVGIKSKLGNVQAALGFIKANVFPEYTELTAFAQIVLPQTDATGKPYKLFFGADNIKLSKTGGIIGEAKLVLLDDVNIPFNRNKWMLSFKGGFNYTTGDINGKTYVTIDCDGVKEISVNGAVEFSRELIVPVVKATGEVDSKETRTVSYSDNNGIYTKEVPNRVRGEFQFSATDWNDILVKVSLQPFTLAKKRSGNNYDSNFLFYANNAILDFSDLRNDAAVKFPSEYTEQGLLLPSTEAWRGVYIQTVDVKLPKEFKTNSSIASNTRIGFGAHDLIIDNNGISGELYADNLFPLDEGRTNENKSWQFSLDHIGVTLVANQLKAADFNGQILLPVSKADTNEKAKEIALRYAGFISPNEYMIKVSNQNLIEFSLWKAKGKLEPNSSIELKVVDGAFRPKAILTGSLSINGNPGSEEASASTETNTNSLVKFEGIKFQNLQLQTVAPIIQCDYFGYEGDVFKVSNFPVSISNIGITLNEQEASLRFSLGVKLMKDKFKGDTTLKITGAFDDAAHYQRWKFKKLSIERISLAAKFSKIELSGTLDIMRDNPIYGDGFAASISGKFNSIGPITCSVIFGAAPSTQGEGTFRYWMVDASVDGLNIPLGYMSITGFAGGASYGMVRGSGTSQFSAASYTPPAYDGSSPKPIDLCPTKLAYKPDETAELGVKAMLKFAIGTSGAINGGAGFEMIFLKTGGINRVGFYGEVQIMDTQIAKLLPVDKLNERIKEANNYVNSVSGGALESIANSGAGESLLAKAKNKDLIAPVVVGKGGAIAAYIGMEMDLVNDTFHAELDVFVDIFGIITGRGPNNNAGHGVIHIAKDDWYSYFGTPDQRIGVKVGFASFNIQAGAYFMTGYHLPPAPPPPPIVAQILGVSADELNYMRNENELQAGKGFAFGQDFSIDTGDMQMLFLYARFQAGGGFDLMMKDYGEAMCKGSDKKIGINGYYANGQAYAYLQGEMGVRMKLFFTNIKIPIISAGAAILLQAKGPNPFWMRGYLGGHFNVMGGLIKGRFRLKVELGEVCEFQNASPLGGMKLIADVSPKANTKDVDIFAIPQATFSLKVNTPIVIPEDVGDKTYKVNLEKFKVTNKGVEIPGKLEWNEQKDAVNFVSTDILPPNTELKAEAEVSFMKMENGVFTPIMVEGKVAKETEERIFTTGTAPTVIPLTNIQYAYPVVDQKYFFKEENNKAYIQLKRGQDYLFEDGKWKTEISYTDADGNNLRAAFTYNQTENSVDYDLPNLSLSKTYKLKIVSTPKEASASATPTATSTTTNDGNGNVVETRTNEAKDLSRGAVFERLSYDFGTSKYKTLQAKINSISNQNYAFGVISSDVIYLANSISDNEPFDVVDLTGSVYTDNKPLLSATATLQDTYFTQDINPPLYATLPLNGTYAIGNRDANILGIPPTRAVPISSYYLMNMQYNVNQATTRTMFPYQYNLPLLYKQDWVNIRDQIANDYVNGLVTQGSAAYHFLGKEYLFMRSGDYYIKVQYIMPGNKLGTQKEYKFKNNNNFRP